MLELAQAVLKLTGSKSELKFVPLPQDDPKQRCPDISKAQEVPGLDAPRFIGDGPDSHDRVLPIGARERRPLMNAMSDRSPAHAGRPQGNHSGRRCRHAALSGDPRRQQAALACLRQADDLLSALDPDAGGNAGNPGDQHAARSSPVSPTSGGRIAVGIAPRICRAAESRRVGAGVSDRADFHRPPSVVPGAGR